MKKYLLFAGDDYYPAQGWQDFITDADTIEELTSLVSLYTKFGKYVYFEIDHPKWECNSPSDQWLHIVDRDSKEIVYEDSTRNHYNLLAGESVTLPSTS